MLVQELVIMVIRAWAFLVLKVYLVSARSSGHSEHNGDQSRYIWRVRRQRPWSAPPKTVNPFPLIMLE